MKLQEIEQVYSRDAAAFGHLRGLQAVFNLGVKEGERASQEELHALEVRHQWATQNFGHETTTATLIDQVLDMGQALKK